MEVKQSLECSPKLYSCTYTVSDPLSLNKKVTTISLKEILEIREFKKIGKGRKCRHYSYTEYVICTPKKYLKIPKKIYEKFVLYYEQPFSEFSQTSYQLGVIPLSILFLLVGFKLMFNKNDENDL